MSEIKTFLSSIIGFISSLACSISSTALFSLSLVSSKDNIPSSRNERKKKENQRSEICSWCLWTWRATARSALETNWRICRCCMWGHDSKGSHHTSLPLSDRNWTVLLVKSTNLVLARKSPYARNHPNVNTSCAAIAKTSYYFHEVHILCLWPNDNAIWGVRKPHA